MDYPIWNTQSFLGRYDQDTSFDITPIVISFSAGPGTVVSLLNGMIPGGLQWSSPPGSSSVVMTGVADPSSGDIRSRFTFRLRQSNGNISDRTFSLDLAAPVITPDWSEQQGFLGYQDNISPKTYFVNALTPPGLHVSYGLLSVPPGQMTIDAASGKLVYNANVISSNYTAIFNVRATSGTVSSDIDLTIGVVTAPFEPRWITPTGALENPMLGTTEFFGGDFLEVSLTAVDVRGEALSYSMVSSPTGFPFTLDNTGLLFGTIPEVAGEVSYSFTVRATSVNGTADRVFSVDLFPSVLSGLLSWVTPADLGNINDGRYVEIPIKALTRRTPAAVVYSLVGGLPPPHLMLDKNSGLLVGYCEYHPVSRDYWFEIQASDGIQTIIRAFKLRVSSSYSDQFFGAYIPLTGSLRNSSYIEISNLTVRAPGSVNTYSIQNPIFNPRMDIINGVVTGYDMPGEILANVAPWMHQLDLSFGPVATENVTTGTDVVYRNINCQQHGSNLSVYSSAVYNTNVETNGVVYPISIDNLRLAFMDNWSLVQNGGGTGLEIFPKLDWSNGGLQEVVVIGPGRDYKSKPVITVSGSGHGASVDPILGLVGAAVSTAGQGWQAGDTVEVVGNDPINRANIRISDIGTNGSAATIQIIDPGSYRQVSSAKTIVLSKDTARMEITPTWGIWKVDVIDSGSGYQCGITLGLQGNEILPSWQQNYFPAVELGRINATVAELIPNALNFSDNTLWGTPWRPSHMVWTWQGLQWLGETTFEDDWTSFDGGLTNFQETENPTNTIFDDDLAIFDGGSTIFDDIDPLGYDLFQVWGGTLIDSGTTVFDLYSTIFDMMKPRTTSKTLVQRWMTMNNRIYSGNNAVW
jgi:hypothetical protein